MKWLTLWSYILGQSRFLSLAGVTLVLAATALVSSDAGDIAPSVNPVFVTTNANGGWSNAGYYVHNNMWNAAKYTPCTSTLYAWSFDHWYVLARMNNKTGDGAVKTYPNVHRDYRNAPLESFESITSNFAENSPKVGVYNVAYDIWINGVATPGCGEIMIWTDNFHQVPGGRFVQNATFASRSFRVYKDRDNRYIAFVAATNFESGRLDLLEMTRWTIAQGWLPSHSTLNQICFGVETVSTEDAEAKFEVTAFSIEEKRKAAIPSDKTGGTQGR